MSVLKDVVEGATFLAIVATPGTRDSEDSDSQLREEVKDLMSLARTRDHKALKVEKTLKMLIDVQQENSEAAAASDKLDN